MCGKKMCENCIHYWSDSNLDVPVCHNAYVRSIKKKANYPDPYDCEFFDAPTDDYWKDVGLEIEPVVIKVF